METKVLRLNASRRDRVYNGEIPRLRHTGRYRPGIAVRESRQQLSPTRNLFENINIVHARP